MKWKHCMFPAGNRVEIKKVTECFAPGSINPISMMLMTPELACEAELGFLELLDSASGYRGLSVLLADGCVDSWLLGLASAVDIVLVSERSVFSAKGLSGRSAEAVALMLSQVVGKCGAMSILLDKEIPAARMYELGLVARIVKGKELQSPEEFIEGLFSEVVLETIPKLKRTWAKQKGLVKADGLAVERLEFRDCFEEGAVADITGYLINRVGSR